MKRFGENEFDYKEFITSQQDFPKEGVLYWDFTPMLKDPAAFRKVISDIKEHFQETKVTKIAAIESKGFTIGSALAYEINLPLVLIRKPHLTPGKVVREEFIKEYGKGEYQVKVDSFGVGDRVLIVYDIMAGAGATKAAINLAEKCGAEVVGCAYVIELKYLGGRDSLDGYDLFSLVKIREKKAIEDHSEEEE